MADLYEDWPQEREGIIDDTLETLRDQRDTAQEQTLSGHQTFSPSAFATGKTMVIGPVRFETGFNSKPIITLSQEQGSINRADMPAVQSGLASSYEPLITYSYIFQWINEKGTFDGFYIGLYALTTYNAALHTANPHTIHWVATGKASVYHDEQQTDESWVESYDHSDATYLEESADTEYTEDIDMDTEYPEL